MHKKPLEHRIRIIKLDSENWEDEAEKIEELADEMQEEGFALMNVSTPNSKVALVVFTRPRR